MLLVDARIRRFESVDPSHIIGVAICPPAWCSDEDARSWLFRTARVDADAVRALVTELARQGEWSAASGAAESEVVTLVAHGMSSGRIKAAVLLSEPTIWFDDQRPCEVARGAMSFATLAMAADFAAELAKDPASAGALARAMAHHAGRSWRAAAGETATRPADLARLLYAGTLVVWPMGIDTRTFRIAWRHAVVGSGQQKPAAPRPVTLAPKPQQGPRSDLPIASIDAPEQCQCLIAAAQSGAPFVEEYA